MTNILGVKPADKLRTIEEILARMRAQGDPRNVEGMARFGISVDPEKASDSPRGR